MASGATIGQLSEVERVIRRLDEVAANFQF